ncbi:Gamma-tubulin complex component 4 [Podochytrium sp. JEL0797]|nr:Gamma-tubulin complex component 4 [Podochytrium sp. JEL0797]
MGLGKDKEFALNMFHCFASQLTEFDVAEIKKTADDLDEHGYIRACQKGSYSGSLSAEANRFLQNTFLKDVAALEKDSLASKDPRTRSLFLVVNKYERIFPHLIAFLDLLLITPGESPDSPAKPPRLHGLQINNALYKMTHSTGVKELKDLWSILLKAVNGVMGRQLIAWMVYGKLEDSYDEFFVAANVDSDANTCRNYYLLGRGDFFVSYIEGCDALCRDKAARLGVVSEQDLGQLLNKVALSFGTVSVQEEEVLRRLSFKKSGG